MYYIIQKYMPKTTKQNTKQAFDAVLTILFSNFAIEKQQSDECAHEASAHQNHHPRCRLNTT